MASIVWLHCNKCASYRPQQFYITKCGHILCKACSRRAMQSEVCPACKLPISKIIPLDKNTPPEVVNSFKPDVLTQMLKVSEYQNKQNDSYLEYAKRKCDRVETEFRKLQNAYEQEQKTGAELDKLLETLRFTESGRTSGRNDPRRGGLSNPLDITPAMSASSLNSAIFRRAETLAFREQPIPSHACESPFSSLLGGGKSAGVKRNTRRVF